MGVCKTTYPYLIPGMNEGYVRIASQPPPEPPLGNLGLFFLAALCIVAGVVTRFCRLV